MIIYTVVSIIGNITTVALIEDITHTILGISDDYVTKLSVPSGFIKHGVLENGPLISGFPIETQFIGDFPASHVL